MQERFRTNNKHTQTVWRPTLWNSTHIHTHTETKLGDMTLTPCLPLPPLLPRLSFVCQSILMHTKSDQVFYYSVFHPLFFSPPPPPLFPLSGGGLGGGFVFSHRFCQSRPGRRLPGWHVASGLQWLETSRSLSPSWSSLLRVLPFISTFSLPASSYLRSPTHPPLHLLFIAFIYFICILVRIQQNRTVAVWRRFNDGTSLLRRHGLRFWTAKYIFKMLIN